MRYLITGANGQLGKEWVLYCDHHKLECRGYRSTDLDITNPRQVDQVLNEYKPNVIINCAAYTKVDDAETNSEQAYLVNEQGARNLAQWCKVNDSKLVHYSTDYVFPGSVKDSLHYPNGYTEGVQTQPINVYGASKLAGEQAIQEVDGDFLILRVSWLCGKHTQTNFVFKMVELAEKFEELTVVDDQMGAPTFTSNVVENTQALIDADEKGIFHISSDGICTWYQFALAIFELTSASVKVKPVSSSAYPTAAKRPAFSKLSTMKLETISGSNIIPWKQGLKKLIEEL